MQSGEKRPPRRPRRLSDGIIQSVTGLAIVAGLALVGGFAYAGYAAFGGKVGTVLGSSTNTATGTSAGPGTTGGVSSSFGGGSSGPGNSAVSGGVNQSRLGTSKTVHLVAIGDSLTHGLGDISGQGYVGDVVSQLRKSGYAVIQSNLGIDGLTSAGLTTEVEKPSTISVLSSANIVLISIGGNDLSQAAGLPNINTNKIAQARRQFETNLKQVLTTIRKVNTNASILLVGLYNPYGDVKRTASETDSIVETWNADEQNAVAGFNGTIVVQTYDLFQLNPTRYLYIDHFHPNQLGYQRIADRVWQDVQSVLPQ